jgi:type I restriction enzyme S subunit
MTADFRPYPATKDSGVEWLGNVPAHWNVFRAGRLLREVDVRSKTGTETHLSMSQRLGLVPSSEIEERRLVSESYISAKLCELDDLVLNRLKAHLGVFARVSQAGLVSPDYTVLRAVSRDATIAFLEHVLKSLPCRTELRMRAKGLVEGFWRLYTDDFYQIKLPVPPITEQAAIVRFIDHADRRIRRYIRNKQTLIKLLEEQKRAIIHRAVTRGFDAHVRRRPSGVGWIGDVPEHWETWQVRHFAAVGNGSP